MSMPNFPDFDPGNTPDSALTMILTSIAMEELSLSHIINAEGEKLQYILRNKASVEDVLSVNRSIKSLLDTVMQSQMILKNKMECVLGAMEQRKPHNPSHCEPPPKPQDNSCCRVVFAGRPDQCVDIGGCVQWMRASDCAHHLSTDCKKISLRRGGCYVINLMLNLCVTKDQCVSFSIRTTESGKKSENFVCRGSAACANTPFTLTANSVIVSDCSQRYPTDISVVLLSPSAVLVKQSSISIVKM